MKIKYDEKKFKYIFLVYIFLMMQLGLFLVRDELRGFYDFDLVVRTTITYAIGFIVAELYSKYKKKKYGNIPELDERSINIISKYSSIFSYIVLLLSAAILLFMKVTGYDIIDIELAIVYMTGLIISYVIGFFIVRRYF